MGLKILLMIWGLQQAGDQLRPDAAWHPTPASVARVFYSFECGEQKAEISFSNTYMFNEKGSGRSAKLDDIGSSFYTLSQKERFQVREFVLQFAIVETVKARCYQGDVFLDLHGLRKIDLDLHAAQRPGPMPAPVVRTITIRKQGGVRLSHQNAPLSKDP